MKKLLTAWMLAMFLCAPCVSFAADEQDMSKITCKELLASGDEMPIMLSWIDGYLSAKSNNTMMSQAWMEKLGEHMGEYCAKNPGHSIMQAMEAVPAN